MNFFKKAAIFCLSLLTCVSFGIAAVSCAETPNSSNTDSGSNSSPVTPVEPADYTYRISVENAGGFAFSGVDVSLVKNGETIATEKTTSSGYAYFEDVAPDNYDITVANYPAGYETEGTYKTAALSGQEYTATITPTGLLDGTPASNTYYRLGDVIHNFSISTSDGKTFTLSSILAEKQLVVINFWATWCGPCKDEFPAMQNALVAYKNSVDCVAISVSDGKDATETFKGNYGYTFNMAAAGAGNLANYFMVGQTIPRTFMIDRYGVVVFDHVGSMTATSDWTVRFDKFLGDDYVPTIMKNATDIEEDENDNPTNELIKPTYSAPSTADVKATLGVKDDSFKFRFQAYGVKEGDEAYDEYNWPWIVETKGNDTYLKASNQTVNSSYALLYADYTAKAGDVIAFDYKLGSEENCDYLYLMVNGVPAVRLSGYHSQEWNTYYAYVFEEYEAGECELAFAFIKDGDKSVYEDVAYIRNLRVLTKDDIPSDAGSNAHVFRYAAHVLNEDENATTQYKYYDDVVYYSKDDGGDGYYHVGDVNGPILYANIWYASLWNETSAWMLTYNNYFAADGFNYYEPFEEYAWASNQPTEFWGYTPVTAELQELLDLMVKSVEAGQIWDGEYHDKEWLELCCYYQHYADEPYRDTMAGLTFHAAIDMQVGDNQVDVLFAMNPRGFKYEFTATESGIYHVESTSPDVDTYAFLFDENENMLGNYDNKVFVETWTDDNGVQYMDGNFEFFWKFEVGKKYYLLFTTGDDSPASYNVRITYEGATYTYFTPAATYRSQNLATFETFVADAPDYRYSAEDGFYHVVNKDGSLGSVLYLDTIHSTYFFNYSLTARINAFKEFDANGDWTWKVEPHLRPFYHNGVDYTELLDEYCYYAKQNTGELYGFIAVDQRLYEALIAITESKEYGGERNSWLMLCYFYQTIY